MAGCAPALHAAAYDVKTLSATAGGKTLDTAAIDKAIDAAHAAGGCTVYLPAGTYLAGSIRLQSHIALYLDAGATIRSNIRLISYFSAPGQPQ